MGSVGDKLLLPLGRLDDRREQSTTITYTSTTHTAMAASDIHANVTTACSS